MSTRRGALLGMVLGAVPGAALVVFAFVGRQHYRDIDLERAALAGWGYLVGVPLLLAGTTAGGLIGTLVGFLLDRRRRNRGARPDLRAIGQG